MSGYAKWKTHRARKARNVGIPLIIGVVTAVQLLTPPAADQGSTLDVGLVEMAAGVTESRMGPPISDTMHPNRDRVDIADLQSGGQNVDLIRAAQSAAVKWSTYSWATLPQDWAATIPGLSAAGRRSVLREAQASWPRIKEMQVVVKGIPGQVPPQVVQLSQDAAIVIVPVAIRGTLRGVRVPMTGSMVRVHLSTVKSGVAAGQWKVDVLSKA